MQTRKQSMTEAVTNTAVGFGIAMLTWRFVICPLFGITHSLTNNALITTIFTTISVVRGYGIRRLFEKFFTNHDPALDDTVKIGKFLWLDVRDHKHGFRWLVADGEDRICMGTNYHDTQKKATEEAVKYFCKPWSVSAQGEEQ